MINAFVEIAKDPVGFLGAMFTEYKDLLERVATGKATPDDMRKIGEEIGSSIAGALTGSAMNKIFGKVKAFKKMKLDAANAKKTPSAKSKGAIDAPNCVLCFTALAQIQTKAGPKNIKDIVVGDSVLAFDEQSGKFAYQRVDYKHMRYADTVYIIHALGTFIETTSEHPFFVGGEWKRAKNLKEGDQLTIASGELVNVDYVSHKFEHTAVYNFTVENFHTYTVGDPKFLVHNCPPSKLQEVNGRKPRNHEFAGKVYNFDKSTALGKKYPKGVKFSESGFPDFSPYKIAELDVKALKATSAQDISYANTMYKKMNGGKEVPKDYVWHHVENSTKLQLVPRDLHDAVKHTGGRATNATR